MLLVVSYDKDFLGSLQTDVLVCFSGNSVSVIDNDALHLFLCERLFQFFADFLGLCGSQKQHVRFLVFGKDVRDEGWNRVIIAHDDIMSGLQVVDVAFLVVVDSLFDGVGDDTDDDTVEDKSTKQECDAAGYQHPSMDMCSVTAHIQAVQRIGICQQIER